MDCIEICNLCSAKNNIFDLNYAFFVYNGIIPEIIHEFKFKNHSAVGIGLGKIMAENLDLSLINKKFDFIFPVLIHKAKMRERGFTQTEIMAREIAKNTKPQWHLNSHERENNLKNAFAAKKINHKNTILLDDIFTSGVTVNKCSEVLKNSGADYIFSLILSITHKNF